MRTNVTTLLVSVQLRRRRILRADSVTSPDRERLLQMAPTIEQPALHLQAELLPPATPTDPSEVTS